MAPKNTKKNSKKTSDDEDPAYAAKRARNNEVDIISLQ